MKEDRKIDWEKRRVERVLGYHNDKYGTHLKIKGRFADVCPRTTGQLNYDWVCCEADTDKKIAIEVKRITNEKLERNAKVVHKLLQTVAQDICGSLPGEYFLSVSIPDDYNFPLRGHSNNKKMFKDAIINAVREASPGLQLGETKDLKSGIEEALPFKLPSDMSFDFRKLDGEGDVLVPYLIISHSLSFDFDKPELLKFDQLVSHANKQLKVAWAGSTILILIEERYRPIDHLAIAEAFKKIAFKSYSAIQHVYFISGPDVTEIPLPTPRV